MEESHQEVKVFVTTNKANGTSLILEPWGDGWGVEVGDQFCLVFRGPTPALPEVVVREDGIEVWAWRGAAIVTVTKNGEPMSGYG